MGVRAGMVGVVNCMYMHVCTRVTCTCAGNPHVHKSQLLQCSMWQPTSFPRPWNPRNVRVVFGTRMSVTSTGSTCNECLANCFSIGIGYPIVCTVFAKSVWCNGLCKCAGCVCMCECVCVCVCVQRLTFGRRPTVRVVAGHAGNFSVRTR